VIEETDVAERVRGVRCRIEQAARRAGRDPAEVTLVGITKRIPARLAAAGVRAGLTDLGESFVQEARRKLPEIAAALGQAAPPRWHFVGRLQRNKAGAAVRLFDVIQSVDDARLALALDRRAAQEGRTIDVLLQVNLSAEPQKGGLPRDALPALVTECAGLANLRCIGLMTIPAPSEDPEASRAPFAELRELRDSLRGTPGGESMRELSMGMTGDFEVAVEEGATIVRVGTAIFGPRQPLRDEG
jgi:pyridoxal phosphate enzyme (YggS family)